MLVAIPPLPVRSFVSVHYTQFHVIITHMHQAQIPPFSGNIDSIIGPSSASSANHEKCATYETAAAGIRATQILKRHECTSVMELVSSTLSNVCGLLLTEVTTLVAFASRQIRTRTKNSCFPTSSEQRSSQLSLCKSKQGVISRRQLVFSVLLTTLIAYNCTKLRNRPQQEFVEMRCRRRRYRYDAGEHTYENLRPQRVSRRHPAQADARRVAAGKVMTNVEVHQV